MNYVPVVTSPVSGAIRASDARDLLAPIYGWFTEGFDTPVLQDAKVLLDQLVAHHDFRSVKDATYSETAAPAAPERVGCAFWEPNVYSEAALFAAMRLTL
jgi:hypothetical protein